MARLTKAHRVLKAGEYEAIFSAGTKLVCGGFVLFHRPNTLKHPRLGLVVSRKVGNAVVRNRVKRVLRETFRTFLSDTEALPELARDVVVLARPSVAQWQRPEMHGKALGCFRRLFADKQVSHV